MSLKYFSRFKWSLYLMALNILSSRRCSAYYQLYLCGNGCWCNMSSVELTVISNVFLSHYIDVIMTTVPSQITSLTSVYSIVYSGEDQRKHQSSPSLAFVQGIHRDRWIPRTKGQLRGKCFHLMTSSCHHCLMWICNATYVEVIYVKYIIKNDNFSLVQNVQNVIFDLT